MLFTTSCAVTVWVSVANTSPGCAGVFAMSACEPDPSGQEQHRRFSFRRRKLTTVPEPPGKDGRVFRAPTDDKSEVNGVEESVLKPKLGTERDKMDLQFMVALEIEELLPERLRRMNTKQAEHYLQTAEPRLLHSTLPQEQVFTSENVGAFSCHGIEPHPYIVDGGSSLFADLTDATLITILTRKINQDRGHVTYPYGGCERTVLFAAYDGHGERGELVAQYAMYEIQSRLHRHPDYERDIEKAIHETFVAVDTDISRRRIMQPLFSGSTACVALLRDKTLFVSNVGDSRAVLARRMPNRENQKHSTAPLAVQMPMAIDLTTDQNASCPVERDRIVKSGGFVSMPERPGLPPRIWLDPACTRIGLAMSRSLGDHALKRSGVIPNPVVTRLVLTEQDEFVIVATDGVWEFIDSQEAVGIVADFFTRGYGASEACVGLIQAAMKKWREVEGDYRDDITAIVVRVGDLWGEEEDSTIDAIAEKDK